MHLFSMLLLLKSAVQGALSGNTYENVNRMTYCGVAIKMISEVLVRAEKAYLAVHSAS